RRMNGQRPSSPVPRSRREDGSGVGTRGLSTVIVKSTLLLWMEVEPLQNGKSTGQPAKPKVNGLTRKSSGVLVAALVKNVTGTSTEEPEASISLPKKPTGRVKPEILSGVPGLKERPRPAPPTVTSSPELLVMVKFKVIELPAKTVNGPALSRVSVRPVAQAGRGTRKTPRTKRLNNPIARRDGAILSINLLFAGFLRVNNGHAG